MTKTNPELEAVIEANPDDEDGYYVYGDWLSTEGDPRGELIALHAAQLRKPGDKALGKEIERHIDAHKAELLGELTKLKASDLELHWHLGFVRHAKLHIVPHEVKAALHTLLDHPSLRFLQVLSVAKLTFGSSLDPSVVVSELLALKKPKTLKDLFIGTGWDIESEPRAAELKQVFPRLRQSVAVKWQSLMETVKAARRIEPTFDASELPLLETIDGLDLSEGGASPIDMTQVLIGLRLEIEKKRDLGMVAAMRAAFTKESLDQLALAIGEQLGPRGDPTPKTKWGFVAMGLLGDDLTASWIGERWGGWSHQRSVQAAEMLSNMSSPLALYELFGMISNPRLNRPRRDDAQTLLEKAAKRRSMEIDQLLDRCVPNVASNAGVKERIEVTTTRRLERHMVDGRRLTSSHFRHYFMLHPLISPLARRVVWAAYDGDRVAHVFRLDAKDTLAGVDGRPIGDVGSLMIGILHPAELAEASREATLKAWRQALAAAKFQPLFAQIDRPVHKLRAQEQGDTIARFSRRSSEFDRMRAVMEYERDWAPAGEYEHGGTSSWAKAFPRDRAWVIASLGGFGRTIESVKAVRLGKYSEGIPFRTMHPVTVSEILFDLETATAESSDLREEKAKQADEASEKTGVKKGDRVRIGLRGDTGKGQWGNVFWLGQRAGVYRCGVRADDGETHWVDVSALEKLTDEDRERDAAAQKKRAGAKGDDKTKPAAKGASAHDEGGKNKGEEPDPAALKKGMRVTWRHGAASGTGAIFWLGEGKFGGGPRAGIKDDATGETVWADAAQCEPLEVQGKPTAATAKKPTKKAAAAPVEVEEDDDYAAAISNRMESYQDDSYDDIDE